MRARIGGELQKTLFREGQAVTLGVTLFVAVVVLVGLLLMRAS